jgi:HEAT repeat protein
MKIWHKKISVTTVLLLCMAIPVQAIPRQSRDVSRLKNKSSLELIEIWEEASRTERWAIQDLLIDDIRLSAPVLRSKILTGTRQQKLFCCAVIAEARDVDSASVLLQALDDPDDKVKIRAISSLRTLKAKQSLGKIRQELFKTQNKGVIKASLTVLGALGHSRDIVILEKFLSHADEGVRIIAAAGMALLNDYRGQDILLAGTDSANSIVKKEAIYSLGFVNTAKAKDKLQEIIDDPDGQWKSYAEIGLAQHELRNNAIGQQLNFLETLTNGKNQRVGRWAVEKLADMNSPQGDAILRKIEKDNNPTGRKAKRILRIKGVK